MGYTNILARLALSLLVVRAECCDVLCCWAAARLRIVLDLIHTFSAHIELQRKAVFGYEKLDNT